MKFDWRITHPLLGFVYSAIIGTALALLAQTTSWELPRATCATLGFLLPATFFYAREAGQLEHDYKRAGMSEIEAWLRAEFGVWPLTNWLQAGSAIIGALAASIIVMMG